MVKAVHAVDLDQAGRGVEDRLRVERFLQGVSPPVVRSGLGQVEVALEVAVHADHASFLVGQRQVREARLMQTALEAGQHRDVLGQHQSGVCLVGRHSHVGRLGPRPPLAASASTGSSPVHRDRGRAPDVTVSTVM